MATPKPNKSMDGIPDYKFKICIIGAAAAGKTTIVEKLINDKYNPETKATVGVEYKPYRFDIGDFVVQLELWDTAGQEAYKAVAKSYFRNAVGCILVFDLTDQKSFEELQFWLGQFRQLASPNATVLLLGNKADLDDQRQITSAAAEKFAQDNLIGYFETSAISGQNILEAFQKLAKEIFDKVRSQKLFVDGTGHAVQKEDVQQHHTFDLQNELDEIESQKRCVC